MSVMNVDQILVQREEAIANATIARLRSESDANKFKLTKEFLHLEAIQALAIRTHGKNISNRDREILHDRQLDRRRYDA